MTGFNSDKLLQLYHRYREDVPGPINLRIVADHLIKSGQWQPQPDSLVTQLSELLSNALREEYYTDPQGRRVRINHAIRVPVKEKGEQSRFWDDIRTATREYMQTSLQQRRQSVVNDCHQLVIDAASFNQNREDVEPIQLSLDFRADMEELDPVNLALVSQPSEPPPPFFLSRVSNLGSALEREPSLT